jgi:hypothetical protein
VSEAIAFISIDTLTRFLTRLTRLTRLSRASRHPNDVTNSLAAGSTPWPADQSATT